MVNQQTVKLLVVGDIMLGRLVNEMFSNKKPPYPFEHVIDYLRKGDIVFGNLEVPLSKRGLPNTRKPSEYTFRGNPEMAYTLKHAGFTILSLANNHIFDYGFDAFRDTTEALSKAGIIYVGAGANLSESRLLRIVENNGMKIGFLAYTYAYHAGSSKSGCAPLIPKIMKVDINEVRSRIDILVVSLHHGIEFVDYPTPFMREISRKVTEWGADIVIGHHPHTLQGIEKYKNSLIAYSLGDFVFDNVNKEVRKAAYARTEISLIRKAPLPIDDLRITESVILECELSINGVESYRVIPIMIGEDFQPRPALEKEGRQIQERLERISQPLLEPNHPIWKEMQEIQEEVRNLNLRKLSFIDVLRMFTSLRLQYLKSFVTFLMLKVRSIIGKPYEKNI